VWSTHRRNDTSRQSLTNRVLLAYASCRRHRDGTQVRQVPTLCPCSSSALSTVNCHPLPPAFCKLGNGYLGPISQSNGAAKYLLVAVDYFTKWVEAEAVASITEHEVRKFIWKNIITRFGVPQAIIFDNGRQFDTDKLRDYCAGYGIQTRYTAVARPQTNGQVESTNKQILSGLKKRMDAAKGSWADELPAIL